MLRVGNPDSGTREAARVQRDRDLSDCSVADEENYRQRGRIAAQPGVVRQPRAFYAWGRFASLPHARGMPGVCSPAKRS
jgi:hypothetical protein